MKLYIILVLSTIILYKTSSSDAILGQYWAEDKTGKIAIVKCGDKYCGRLIWKDEDRKDTKNPDKEKRERSIIGIQFLNDFKYNSNEKTYEGGTVYSIDDGKTYSGKMWLEDSGKTLKMRGFIGFSLIGKTAVFQRID